MNTWILFVWLTLNGKPTAIATQEFNTKAQCLKTIIRLHDNIGNNMGGFCTEKGKK